MRNVIKAVENWYEAAEELPDVFNRPMVKPQGLDGTPHFSYFDYDRQLSFIWDGETDQAVNVSFGGAGEPVKWTFDFMEVFSELGVNDASLPIPAKMASAVGYFQRVCDAWIDKMEQKVESEAKIFVVIFDEGNRNWAPNYQHNLLLLRGIQNYMNERLRIIGHVFLNDVFDAIGHHRTSDGAICGWLLSNHDRNISFDITEHNAHGSSISIKLQTDGVIYDKI